MTEKLAKPKSLETAIKVNLLSPNPYLFWFTVGGTYLVLGTQLQSIVFIVVSIGTLVVSKMVTAWVAADFREFLDSSAYVVVMKFLGLLLAAFGVLFIIRGQNILFG
jgi:threonine/homoserine/homoserine lactone efflux protein